MLEERTREEGREERHTRHSTHTRLSTRRRQGTRTNSKCKAHANHKLAKGRAGHEQPAGQTKAREERRPRAAESSHRDQPKAAGRARTAVRERQRRGGAAGGGACG